MAISPGGRPADASPVGTPGGQQNWVDKAGGLPTYIRMVAHALMRKGMAKQHAIAAAVNRVKRWAAGMDNVRPQVQAAAAAAVAEWEAKKGMALSSSARVDVAMMLDLAVPDVWQAELEATYRPSYASLDFAREYVRDKVGKFANDQTKNRGAEQHRKAQEGDGEGPVRDRKVQPGELKTLGGIRALIRDWTRIPIAERASLKPRVTAAAKRLGASPRLMALIAGLGDGDFKADKSEGAGVALKKNTANAWLKRAGFDLSVDDAEGQLVLELAAAVGDELADNSLVDLAGPVGDVLDLAPGDHRPPYDWKHGFIPITPAAAASKAKKGPNVGKGSTRRPRGVSVPGRTSRSSTSSRGVAGKGRKPEGPKAPAPDAKVLEQFTSANGSRVRKHEGGAHTIDGRPVSAESYDAAKSAHRGQVEKGPFAPVQSAAAKAADDEKRGRGVPGEQVRHEALAGRIERDRQAAADTAQRRADTARRGQARRERLAANGGEQRKGLREPLSTERKIPVSEVEAGDVVVEPGRSGTKRYRIEEIHPPKSGNGDRNVRATDLETGDTHDMSLDGLRQQLVEKRRQPRQGPSETGSVVRDMEARRARRQAARASGDYPKKADGSPDYAAMSATQQHQVRARLAGRGEGDKVTTDQGPGTVTRVSSRGTTIKLDSGDSINVVNGTPGHDRIKPANDPRAPKPGDQGSTAMSGKSRPRGGRTEPGELDTSGLAKVSDESLVRNIERYEKRAPNSDTLKALRAERDRRNKAHDDALNARTALPGEAIGRNQVGDMIRRADEAHIARKEYGKASGPALADEVAKRKLMGREMAVKKSDSQLRTMLRNHDKNPAASHEDNARARSRRVEPDAADLARAQGIANRAGAMNPDTAKGIAQAIADGRAKGLPTVKVDVMDKIVVVNTDLGRGKGHVTGDGRTQLNGPTGFPGRGKLPRSEKADYDAILTRGGKERYYKAREAGKSHPDALEASRDPGGTAAGRLANARRREAGEDPTKPKGGPRKPGEGGLAGQPDESLRSLERFVQSGQMSDSDKQKLRHVHAEMAQRGLKPDPSNKAETGGPITPDVARRMSDDQLEAAMSRLMQNGQYSGPAFPILEAELNRRDKARRAEGNGPRR